MRTSFDAASGWKGAGSGGLYLGLIGFNFFLIKYKSLTNGIEVV